MAGLIPDNPFALFNPTLPEGESENDYYADLGRFITSYADAESAVHELTRFLSKLSEVKARVIFAGMRLGDLTDRIRAMLRADNVDAETCAEIDACLGQLDKIADARNKLVHRSVVYAFGSLSVSNLRTAKTKAGAEFHTFSRAQLQDMNADCGGIFLRLLHIAEPDSPPEFRLPDHVLRQPWRYTPAPPTPRTKSPPKARRSRKPPPDASRG